MALRRFLLMAIFGLAMLWAAPQQSFEGLTPDDLVGQYRREPVLNKWHQGSIAWDASSGERKLRWKNEAGVSWDLTPELKIGILITDFRENPYYDNDPARGRTFRIRMRPGNAGVDGFEFMGDFYAKVYPSTTVIRAAPTLQASGCLSRPAGLIGWWPGDDDFNDIVGGHNPNGVNAVSIVPAKVGRGFQFGQEGYIEIPQSESLENQQFTWLAWVKPEGPGPNASSLIINQNIDGTHASVNLAWRTEDQRFTFHSGHNRDDLIASGDSFPAGQFYLVAATYDGRAFRLYVNGELQGSRWQTKTVPYSSYGWEIGAGALRFFPGNADTFNGVIDELQAYDRALSLAEMQSIYRAGSAGVCKQSEAPVVPTAEAGASADQRALNLQTNAKDGLKYVWIAPGSFTLGCSEGDTECAANEDPSQSGRIDIGFWLGQTEVTQAAYVKVMGTNPSSHKGDDLPVEMVTWFDAQKYCQAIGGRLPNQKEWEYAARAGTKYARYGNLNAVAWHVGNSENETHPVGEKQPNTFGLYDMLGNVWEWVADAYPQGEAKVERGGSAFSNANELRASSRRGDPPTVSAMGLGLRCAADQPAPAPTDDATALAQYQKDLAANRRNSLAHFRLGEIFLKQNNLQAAANEFRSAQTGDLNPKWTEVWSYINIGKIFDITGQRARAVNEYRKAIATHDNTFGAQDEASRYLAAPYAGNNSAAEHPGSAYDRGPQLLSQVVAEYSDEARNAKVAGSVGLQLTIDADGNVVNVLVTRSLGFGLDEQAIKAVRKWKFAPAQKDGKPVASRASVEVSFRL